MQPHTEIHVSVKEKVKFVIYSLDTSTNSHTYRRPYSMSLKAVIPSTQAFQVLRKYSSPYISIIGAFIRADHLSMSLTAAGRRTGDQSTTSVNTVITHNANKTYWMFCAEMLI